MNRGFTLIELILVVIISGMISVFTFAFIYKSIQTYRIMRTQGTLYQEGAHALERITRELREASSTISATNSNDLSFIKGHGTPQDTNTFVRYYVFGTPPSLYRCSDAFAGSVCLSNPASSATNRLMASNVSSFIINGNEGGPFRIYLELRRLEPSMQLQPQPPQNLQVRFLTVVTPKNYPTSFSGDWQDVIN